jgi:predicted lipoprotein with Yx(FWY)xxD motif
MLRRLLRETPAPYLLFLVIIAAGLAGCGSSGGSGGGLYGSNNASAGGNSGASAKTTCASSTAPICTRSVQVKGVAKNVLVTPSGKTLYYFTLDSATASACADGCASTWPPLLSSSATVAPITGLTGVLATVTRSDGTQISYNGHPLYTYAADAAPGDAKGEGVNGKWYVAAVDLAPGSSNDNGYGY